MNQLKNSIVLLILLFSYNSLADDDLYFVPQSMGICSFDDYLREWTVADFDGDGDSDVAGIFVVEAYSPHGSYVGWPYLRLYSNDGSGQLSPTISEIGELSTPFQIPGDWDNNGVDDLLFSVERISLLTHNGTSFIVNPLNLFPHLGNRLYHRAGDFDGDGNLDLLITQYSNNPLAIVNEALIAYGNGEGQIERTDVPCEKAYRPLVYDFNGDGSDDIAFGLDDSIVYRFGASERENVFSTTASVFVRGVTEYTYAYDANGDGNKEILAASGDSTLLISYDNNKGFETRGLNLPDGFPSLNAKACDFNKDGVLDLYSYTGNEVCVALGRGEFEYAELIRVRAKFVDDIDGLTDADVNGDGRIDLIVSADWHYLFSFVQQPIEAKPTPLPSPTATPTRIPILPTPTPTPPIVPAEAKIISTHQELDEAFKTISPYCVFYVARCTDLPFYKYFYGEIKKPPFTLIGTDPINKPSFFTSCFRPNTDEFTIQNFTIGSGVVSPTLELNDCDATVINCTVFGGGSTWTDSPPPSIGIGNSQGKRIVLRECVIDAPDYAGEIRYNRLPSSINISSSTNVEVIFDACEFTADGRNRKSLQIINSQNVVVRFINSNRLLNHVDLNCINATNSTVTIQGAIVRGLDGYTGICSGDGEPGVTASNNSTVTLIESQVMGGEGGAGIFPGEDAPAWTADDTSSVLIQSSLPNWRKF